MLATIRSKGMKVMGIEVLDLSLAGSLIDAGGWMPRAEQRFVMSLPNAISLPGKVLWVENGKAGLLFDNLLNEAVYEHLIANYSTNP